MNSLSDIRSHMLPEGVFSFQRLQFLRLQGLFFSLKEVSSSNQGDFLLGERGFFQPTGIFPLVGEFQSGKGLLLLGENLLFIGREGYLIFGYSVRGRGGSRRRVICSEGKFFSCSLGFFLGKIFAVSEGRSPHVALRSQPAPWWVDKSRL